jgi:6-phosphofructokinase 1
LALDRVLGSRLGFEAVSGLINGRSKQMVGIINHETVFTDFGDCLSHGKSINNDLVELAEILSS